MKQQKFFNNSILILTAPAAAVAIMTFLLSRGNAWAAIGTGITSVASIKAIDRRDLEVEIFKDRIRRFKNAEELTAKLPSLQAETKTLTTRQNELKNNIGNRERELSNVREQLQHTKGELSQKEGTLKVIRQDISDLSKTKDELERRIALVERQNPDLAVRERLYSETEQLRLQRTSLDAQVNSLKSEQTALEAIKQELATKQPQLKLLQQQLEDLQSKTQELEKQAAELERLKVTCDALSLEKDSFEARIERLSPEIAGLEAEKQQILQTIQESKENLAAIKLQIASKQPQTELLQQQLEDLQSKNRELEKQAAELELLRVTYDALSLEKDSFETRISQLSPEIAGLETQKQRILQAIQESEEKYRQIEQQRQESHRLRLEIKQQQHEISNLEREAKQVTGIIASSEEEKARLEQDNHKLEQRLKRLKGEIAEIENSAALALQALRKELWEKKNLPQAKRQIDTTATGEQQFISGFANHLIQQGLTFPQRVINAFHTSLKVQDISALVILAGISGTGKSELPQRYAEYIGAQKLTLAVQPRWDSPQDLQGFYNYIEKKYKPTDLMRGLYQYQNDFNMNDRLVIVLLDEMNLARVEYYFSDFLSKLESRRSQATYLDLDVGSLPLPEEERKLAIPQQFLFVGTMNEDETTQSLSDKVLDRANVLTFGKPQQLKLREEASSNRSTASSIEGYVSYSQFKGWMRKPDPNSEVVNKIRDYLDRANNIMDKLGHPFAHRVYQAITRYVVNYPGVIEGNQEAFNAALADQFGQKLLPKLRGLMLDESSEQLDELARLIDDIGDETLIKAFSIAKKGYFGQFQWRGFVYLEESEAVLSSVG